MTNARAMLLTAAALAASPAAARSAPDTHAARTAQRILTDLRDISGVAGLGAAVWRNGAIVWTGRAGFRDLDRKLPVTDATRFRFASVSKVFAATAAARLRQDGRLDIDAPVAQMLPYLHNSWPAITPRQLAAHISGIPHYQPVDDDIGKVPVTTMPASVAIFANRALLQPPGIKYEYSTFGFTLLSAVVEARAGQPYLDYLVGTIVPGLAIGADTTGTGDPNASRAYEMTNGQPVESKPLYLSYSLGGAGLSGTAPALATWGGRLVTGRVVSPATLAWIGQPARLADGAPVAEADYQLGFGWRLMTDIDGHALMQHAGVTDGARSFIALVPDQKMAVSLLANTLWTASIDRSALAIAAPFRPEPTLVPQACPLEATRFAGNFGETAITGEARFAIVDGICTGSLSTDNAMGSFFEKAAKRKTDRLRLVGIDPAAGLARMALVTPIGAYEFRQAGNAYGGRLGPTRTLDFTFS